MQAEVFYTYHLGEQRGPYTAKQVNHLYRCEFIDDLTLYWREGMEQWQPVVEIVERRRRRNRLTMWATVAAVAAGLGLLVWLFGPVTMEQWREMTSGEFTAESAWWRARGLVRGQLGEGLEVNFEPLDRATVSLQGRELATVVLGGTLRKSGGEEEPARWQVRLRFDATRNQWLPAPRNAPDPATAQR